MLSRLVPTPPPPTSPNHISPATQISPTPQVQGIPLLIQSVFREGMRPARTTNAAVVPPAPAVAPVPAPAYATALETRPPTTTAGRTPTRDRAPTCGGRSGGMGSPTWGGWPLARASSATGAVAPSCLRAAWTAGRWLSSACCDRYTSLFCWGGGQFAKTWADFFDPPNEHLHSSCTHQSHTAWQGLAGKSRKQPPLGLLRNNIPPPSPPTHLFFYYPNQASSSNAVL